MYVFSVQYVSIFINITRLNQYSPLLPEQLADVLTRWPAEITYRCWHACCPDYVTQATSEVAAASLGSRRRPGVCRAGRRGFTGDDRDYRLPVISHAGWMTAATSSVTSHEGLEERR
jgi:hypothetical protein